MGPPFPVGARPMTVEFVTFLSRRMKLVYDKPFRACVVVARCVLTELVSVDLKRNHAIGERDRFEVLGCGARPRRVAGGRTTILTAQVGANRPRR